MSDHMNIALHYQSRITGLGISVNSKTKKSLLYNGQFSKEKLTCKICNGGNSTKYIFFSFLSCKSNSNAFKLY